MSMTITYACDGCGIEMENAAVAVEISRTSGDARLVHWGNRKDFCSEECARDFVFADFAEKEDAA